MCQTNKTPIPPAVQMNEGHINDNNLNKSFHLDEKSFEKKNIKSNDKMNSSYII